MITKLSMAEDRVNKIKAYLEKKKRELAQAEIDLQKVVANGASNNFSMQVVSLQAEVEALKRSLVVAEGELSKAQEFEKSEEAQALRSRISKLEVEYKKIYKGVIEKVDLLEGAIDDLIEKIVNHDKLQRKLGGLPNPVLGYLSLKRKAPYSMVIRLKADLDQFSKLVEKYN